MVLNVELLDFITSAMVTTVAAIDSPSTLRDTCLATEVHKSFTKPTMLQVQRLMRLFLPLLHVETLR